MLKITEAVYYSTKELVTRLKKVTMLGDRTAMPYADASIQVTDIAPDKLSPAQLYLVKGEFEKVRSLRWAFLDRGVDILRLADSYVRDGVIVDRTYDRTERLGFIEFATEGSGETITILPPVVEAWKEADGTSVDIINDGMHRCALARTSRMIPAVVRVEKIQAKYPYYAYPLAGGWADVTMIDELNPNILKKYHRVPDYKRLYRDFSSAFTNVGGPRGSGAASPTPLASPQTPETPAPAAIRRSMVGEAPRKV